MFGRAAFFNLIVGLFAAFSCVQALADAQLQVFPSSTEIGLEENLSLEFKVVSDSARGEIGDPVFQAPGFDSLNTYSGMSGMETSIVNGTISVSRTQSYTVVLHPKQAGKFRISGLAVPVGGKKITAPDIEIAVSAGTTHRSSGSGFQTRSQLPNSGVHPSNEHGGSFFVKTEPSKLKAYRGEQIILTYALYTQVRILGIQAERYPTVPGFLKEDIDIPLLGNHLNYMTSVVNGQEFNRAVLAQYAIYPVKNETLTIDPLTAKFRVQSRVSGHGFGDDTDPFQIMNQFFNAVQAREESRTSNPVQVEVLPLPAQGQPAGFEGLVGDFSIAVSVDKTQLKVGDPLNVTVKIEGKGHAGSLEHLNVDWPKDFELYEDKANTNFMRTGRSERTFNFMVIPKTKGSFQVPAIEIAMFDPDSREYRVRKSNSIPIEVLEGSLGNIYLGQAKKSGEQKDTRDIRYWMRTDGTPSSEWLGMASSGVAAVCMVLALMSLASLAVVGRKAKVDPTRVTKMLLERADSVAASTKTPVEILAEVESTIAAALKNRFSISIGSRTRPELRALLTERGVGAAIIESIEQVLEQCENLRFVPQGSDLSAAKAISGNLRKLLEQIMLSRHAKP